MEFSIPTHLPDTIHLGEFGFALAAEASMRPPDTWKVRPTRLSHFKTSDTSLSPQPTSMISIHANMFSKQWKGYHELCDSASKRKPAFLATLRRIARVFHFMQHKKEIERSLHDQSLYDRAAQLISTKRPDNSSVQLLRLPAELRIQIYGYLVALDQPITFWVKYNNTIDRSVLSPLEIPLLQVCRQIRHEALPMFVEQNVFNVPNWGINPANRDWVALIRWLDLIGKVNAGRLGGLVLRDRTWVVEREGRRVTEDDLRKTERMRQEMRIFLRKLEGCGVELERVKVEAMSEGRRREWERAREDVLGERCD